MANIRGGPPKNQNYLLEGRPLIRLPPLGECYRNPSVSVYLLVVVWEVVFSFSESFWRPITWWVIYKRTCPHRTECSAVFDQKQHDPRAPPSLFTQSGPKWLFFVSLDENSPQRETFCPCGGGETKNHRSTKRHENLRVQKLFWAVGKSLNRCIASNGEYFEGDWSLNM